MVLKEPFSDVFYIRAYELIIIMSLSSSPPEGRAPAPVRPAPLPALPQATPEAITTTGFDTSTADLATTLQDSTTFQDE